MSGKRCRKDDTVQSDLWIFRTEQRKIELNGNDISPLSVKERGEHIGIVMQNPNQMISKPMIYEEVALGLTVRGVPEEEIRERVHETLKICGLYQFRNWPVSALSFGQKKRVTIASILVMKPEILILDEPTAGQDYRHYTEIMEFLKTINETQGTTIIMITHDMHLMLEYTNRAIVVADGQLLTIDTPAKVLTDETITLRHISSRHLSMRWRSNVELKILPVRAAVYQLRKGGAVMAKLLTYEQKDTWMDRLCGVTKLIYFLAWSITSMLTYDTRVLAVMLVLSLILFKISKTEWKQVGSIFKFYYVLSGHQCACHFYFCTGSGNKNLWYKACTLAAFGALSDYR